MVHFGGALIYASIISGSRSSVAVSIGAYQFENVTKDTTNWFAHIPEHIAWTLLSILLPGRVLLYEVTDRFKVRSSAEP